MYPHTVMGSRVYPLCTTLLLWGPGSTLCVPIYCYGVQGVPSVSPLTVIGSREPPLCPGCPLCAPPYCYGIQGVPSVYPLTLLGSDIKDSLCTLGVGLGPDTQHVTLLMAGRLEGRFTADRSGNHSGRGNRQAIFLLR